MAIQAATTTDSWDISVMVVTLIEKRIRPRGKFTILVEQNADAS